MELHNKHNPNKDLELPFHPISSSAQEHKSPTTLDPSPQDLSPSPTLSPGPTPSPMIRYRECRRNHAAHLGSHVVDGCGEFMPSGEEGTPLALKCAACDCHRNFHRRVVESDTTTLTSAVAVAAAATATTNSAAAAAVMPPPQSNITNSTTANCYISFSKCHRSNNNNSFPIMTPGGGGGGNSAMQRHHHHGRKAPVMMAFGSGGGAAESSSEDLNMGQYGGGGGKKRYRTKFSQEQKDKMMEFAEKIGWRMQKQDDVQIQQFCHDVGITRQVFKVWMHNNKQALKKKLPP